MFWLSICIWASIAPCAATAACCMVQMHALHATPAAALRTGSVIIDLLESGDLGQGDPDSLLRLLWLQFKNYCRSPGARENERQRCDAHIVCEVGAP